MIEVLKAEISDAGEINFISHLAFKESYEKYKFCPAYEAADEQVSSWIQNSDAYKIMVDGQIKGSIFVINKGDNEFELSIISIHPEFQNMGIATESIKYVEKQYPDANIWILQTPEEETRNIHLYEKLGYVRVGNERINDFLNLIDYRKELIK